MTANPDPITFELFKNAVCSIADEMALTVFRTTYSGVLKDNMDYSTGFADAEGKLAAQGLTLPGHLGSLPTAMAAILRHFGDDIQPGDVFILNDPFDGGMHLPDIFVVKPLYHGDVRLAFACTVCHHCDVGGRVAGSKAGRSGALCAAVRGDALASAFADSADSLPTHVRVPAACLRRDHRCRKFSAISSGSLIRDPSMTHAAPSPRDQRGRAFA